MVVIFLRLGLVLAGTFLTLIGVWRAYWEIYSWPHQISAGLRPPIYPDGTTRVVIWKEAALSAFGTTLLALALMLG